MVFKEVNIQCDALASTPKGYRNEFLYLHKGEFETINFLMLLVCHYDRKIDEDQFIHYNYGRYQQVDFKDQNFKIYKLGKFNYVFNKEGKLLKFVRS